MFKRLLPLAAVLAAVVGGAYLVGGLGSTPASADVAVICDVDGDTTACTSWSVDAQPGGLAYEAAPVIQNSVVAGVGSSVGVDMVVDSYVGGDAWGSYQVTLDYDDVILDATGIPAGGWGTAPTATDGGNLYPFVGGPLCDPGTPGDAVVGEDDAGSASMAMTCAHAVGANTTTGIGDMVRFYFLCETAGVATLDLRDFADTFLLDVDFENNNDHDHTATIDCQAPTNTPTATNTVPATNTFTPTNTNTPTNTFTPTATPSFESATMDKLPLGGENNVVVTGDSIPLANLFLCEDLDNDVTDDPECDNPNEGEVQWIEQGNSPVSPIGAFEFQIKFDHKIFDINLECVTEQDPGPACTGDADEDNTLNTDADTWDIQLSSQLQSGGDGREWGMNQCFRNVTENYINFACVSTGPTNAGYTGITDLAVVTVHPDEDLKFRLRPGNDNGIVRVILDENCELVDPVGHPVQGSIAGGLTATCGDIAITVRILEGDLNLDCEVDLADAQAIAQLYGMVFGLFLYDPWYDLEPNITDFDIDAKDLQKVFGRIDSNCQNPVPPQPPLAPPQA